MSKKRVHEIAKEFGVESKQVISILQQHNINVTKAVNSVDDSGYEIVKKQFIKKLDDVLWESYGSVQVEKIKFFYDIFLKEGRATTVDFSVKLDANSSTMINGSGNGDIEYKSRQSIYDFVFSDIKYCKLLDEINN